MLKYLQKRLAALLQVFYFTFNQGLRL